MEIVKIHHLNERKEAVLLVSYLCIHFFPLCLHWAKELCVCLRVCVCACVRACVCVHVCVCVKNGADREVKWKLLRYTTSRRS